MAFELHSTPLDGVLLVVTPIFRDARGFTMESYHRRKFAEAGLDVAFVQDNHSRSSQNVVRGLHYQDLTAPMGKLVRCTVGAIFDVAVDLRVGSPTFGRWHGVELTADNALQYWIPPGFGHGFATLSEAAEVQYKCSGFYAPSAEGAVRWNDPDIGVAWPVAQPILSPRDEAAPSLKGYLQKPAFHFNAAGT